MHHPDRNEVHFSIKSVIIQPIPSVSIFYLSHCIDFNNIIHGH